MSGNGGTGRARGPARKAGPAKGKSPSDRCDLEFTVDLSAVNLGVLRTLSKGAVLSVELVQSGDLEAVVCKTRSGGTVGTLMAFEGLAELIDCIRRGNRYSATIIRIDGATCAVHVRRVSK